MSTKSTKSKATTAPVRSSPRISRKVILDESDGKTRTVAEAQSERVSSEAGMDMTEEERQAHNAYIEEGGTTIMVEDGHWADKLPFELKDVHDKMQSFLGTIRNAQHKKQMEEIIATFKHGVEMNHRRDNEPSGSGGASSSGNGKHERMVQVAGAQAFQAATVSGEGQFAADAEMAKAMAKREEKHALELEKKIAEMKKQHDEAIAKAEQQHRKEIVSVAKNAKEEAVKEAEEHNTRFRKKKVDETAEAVVAVENDANADAAAAPGAPGSSGIVLPALVANGMLGEILRSQGREVLVTPGDEPSAKGKGKAKAKAKAKGKAKAVEEPTEEHTEEPMDGLAQELAEESNDGSNLDHDHGHVGAHEKASKKKAAKAAKAAASKRKRDSDDEDEVEDGEKPEPKKRAGDYYKELGISGPSKLGDVVATINELKAESETLSKEVQGRENDYLKLDKKYQQLKADSKAQRTRLNLAIEMLVDAPLDVPMDVLIERGIAFKK